ncbi:hypothetical protein EI969_06905 [Pseudomonas sp. PB101]|nr:hypothetical protein [Pseudomonas sp. PB101]
MLLLPFVLVVGNCGIGDPLRGYQVKSVARPSRASPLPQVRGVPQPCGSGLARDGARPVNAKPAARSPMAPAPDH